MSVLGKILSAPARLVGTVAAVVNATTEFAGLGDMDVFEIEDKAKEFADDIEDAVDR